MKFSDLTNPSSFGAEVIVSGGPFAGVEGSIDSWDVYRHTISIPNSIEYAIPSGLECFVTIRFSSGKLRVEAYNLELKSTPVPSYMELFV